MTNTYRVRPDPSGKVEIAPAPGASITPAMWEALATHINNTHNLNPTPAQSLAGRFATGTAAVALADGQIVSYSSLHILYGPDQRAALSEALGSAQQARLPQIDIWEGASAWTHPDWRGRGITTYFRHTLYARFQTASSFIMSMTVGIGASPILQKLNWRMLGWHERRYLGSIYGWFEPGNQRGVGSGWEVVGNRQAYDGPPITDRHDPNHDWDAYFHMWVSDDDLSAQIDAGFEAAVAGDLAAWRQAVIVVYDDF